MPLKGAEAVRRCPGAINDVRLKPQSSKCNVGDCVRGVWENLGKITLFGQSVRLTLFLTAAQLCFNGFFVSSDLDNFKTQSVRSAVNVREGQGVVLLCGPPPHSGGKLSVFSDAAPQNYLHSFKTANFDE